MWHHAIYGAKSKALFSCAITAQLICVFGFAYTDCWFSGAAAQISFVGLFEKLEEICVHFH